MKVKIQITSIISIFLIIIFTIAIVPKEFQNDTFFTIAIGQNILKNGIELEEKLVWHENLEYTNSRWAFDVITAKIYNMFDFNGIYFFTILMACIQMVLYYYILNKLTNKKFLSLFLTIITDYFICGEFAARAQIISFSLFLLEFYCIEELIKTNKKRYFILLFIIPIILVNCHASVFPVYFVLYFPYIAEYILSKILKKDSEKLIIEKRKIGKIIILVIIGFICGFLTPKGLAPFSDMFKAMGGLSASIIGELQPITIMDETYFIILCCIVFAMIAFTKTKVKITDCFYILGFAIMALTTKRCIFFLYLISSICIYRIFSDYLDYRKIEYDFLNKKIKSLGFIIFAIFIVIHSINLITQKSSVNFISTESYPVDAVNYILDNIELDNMRIYNVFDFGSYLELNGIKAFIDSRSGVFSPEFNKGCTILQDNVDVFYGNVSYKTIFDKYKITHALLENTEIANIYIVDDENWKLIYQDDIFSLYERINEK